MTGNTVQPWPLIQVINSEGWGGREQLPIAIHRHWQKHGRDIRLMVGAGTEMARRSGADATVESLPTGRWSFAMALRDRIRRYQPAAIICHFTHDLPAVRLAYVGRRPSASPATGSHHQHQTEQQALVDAALETP